MNAVSIPDDLPIVAQPPYGDDMTTRFQVNGQWYTMRYTRFCLCTVASGILRPTNARIVETALKLGMRAVRYIPAPAVCPTGFIYLV
jgi:hypothetical protein